MITFWENPQDHLQFLVLQKHLESQGYKYLGNSAPTADSEDFNAEVIRQVQRAEKVMISPVIEYNSLFSSSTIVSGKLAYFAYPAGQDEDLPDTLRGGFRVEQLADPYENPAGSFAKITRRLPSELLNELERQNVLLEYVKEFYFEHPGGYEALVRCGLLQFKDRKGQKLHYPLSKDDLLTLYRMENDKVLDLKRLNKAAPEEDRRAGKSLKDLIVKGLAVPIRKSSSRHTLSKAATEGEYTALVEKRYMPDYHY